jgi:hypothetical protein
MDPDVTYPPTRLAFRAIVVLGGIRVVSKRPQRYGGTLSPSDYSAYLRRLVRADERTRTADLLITSELLYLLSYVGLCWAGSIS